MGNMCVTKVFVLIFLFGTLIGFIIGKAKRPKKTFRKKTNKALNAISCLLTSAYYIFK